MAASNRILVLIPNHLLQYSVRLLLLDNGWSSEDVVHVSSVEEAQTNLRSKAFGLAIVGGHSLEQPRWVRNLRIAFPDLPILAATALEEVGIQTNVFRMGANGVLSWRSRCEDILRAVHTVLAGKHYLSHELTERLLQQRFAHSSDATAPSSQPPVAKLSPRELEIFLLTGRGLLPVQIAAELKLSPKTVETYLKKMRRKLSVRYAAELTTAAIAYVLLLES